MGKKLSKRKMESYRRAEKVARELRYQLSDARHATEMNYNILFDLVASWMRVAGNIKYKRP